jgi:MSHA biogenesis protein MshE
MTRPERVRLGDLLVKQGYLSSTQIDAALKDQVATGRKLGRILLERGDVTEEQIAVALGRQMALPYVNVDRLNLDPDVVRLLPESQARRFRALVLSRLPTGLQVAMADPTDLAAYDELCRLLRAEVELAVVTESQVLEVVDRVYRRTHEISGLAKALEADLAEVADFGQLLTSSGQEDAPVVRLLQSVFDDALQVKASDIHFEPQEGRLQIRFRIDGVLHPQTTADLRIAAAVALRLKLISGLDISEKRQPQDGRFVVKSRERPLDVRISTMPTQYGESVVMRLLTRAEGIKDLNDIAMPATVLRHFRAAIARPNGLVLVTGPTGSGKTTTLYAALDELNTPQTKIITVEDPVEYRLAGINQVQVNEKIDLSFSKVLRSALRQDPDVLLIGEIRDLETAQIGLRAAMTGHMVLATLHTNDAASAPLRLVDMGVPGFLVASALQGVLAQRLVRRCCVRCQTEHPLEGREAEWLAAALGESSMPVTQRFGNGCSHCNNTGYLGRIGVYEFLDITRSLASASSRQDPGEFLRLARQQMGRHTLRHQAAALVRAGITTVAEAMKVSHETED